MNVTKSSLNVNLSDSQITDLARPLVGILQKFYEDPKNEEDFQKMATQCRESKRKPRRNLIRLYGVLVGLAVAGMAIGFAIGKFTAPQKTVTITEKVEVPVYESGALPKNADVFLYDIPLSDSLQRYIYEICAEKSVPVTLALAMIEHESGFNPEVVSSTNDYGLMQINAVNHDWLEEQYRTADFLNPYQNAFCGITIIGGYIEKYGDYGKALMAYNMGDYGAQKAWESGVTNTNYSSTILELMQEYEEVSHNAKHDGA